MGNTTSHKIIQPVNYYCPKCMEEGKYNIPNIAGRFHIINESQCQCNGCGSVFKKTDYFVDVKL